MESGKKRESTKWKRVGKKNSGKKRDVLRVKQTQGGKRKEGEGNKRESTKWKREGRRNSGKKRHVWRVKVD